MAQYLQEFKDLDTVISSFEADPNALTGATVHLAWYGYGSYCGSALVIFEKAGKLYEVDGSHCSCYGLEGQWEPEETSWEALDMRDLTDSEYESANEADRLLHELTAKFLNKETGDATE
jgi:hypothetical protein